MSLIKPFVDSGKLEKFQIEREQIIQHVQAAFQDLNEARKTFPVSDKAAYLFAYTAMLKIGRALLFSEGYRPKGLGQHETVIEVSGSILGNEFGVLTQRFDAMRRKRNKVTYDIGGLVSHQEAQDGFDNAEQYLKKVRDFMEKKDPQLKLKLD